MTTTPSPIDDELIDYPEYRPYILGVVERCGSPPAICYDYSAVIDHLTRDIGDRDSAVEYFEFNVIGAYVGPHTPYFLDRSMAAALRGGASGADGEGADS